MKKELEMISSPSAELCTHQNGEAWFCVRTNLKHEHIAAAHLRQLVGIEVFNPQLRILRCTRLGRKWGLESLFPNYIFARFVLEGMLEKVSYTPGVRMVLRFGDRVPEIPESVIEDLRRDLDDLGSKVVTDAPLEGEEVEIVGGAFEGMKASVARLLPGKQRAQVLLEVMSQLVPIELSLDKLLFKRREAAQFALSPGEAEPLNAATSPILPVSA